MVCYKGKMSKFVVDFKVCDMMHILFNSLHNYINGTY